MIKIKQKVLTRILIALCLTLVGALTIFMIVYGTTVKYSVEKEKIEEVIQKQLPVIKEVPISQHLPKVIANKIGTAQVTILDIKTIFKNDKINLNIIGTVDFEEKKYPFHVNFDGKPIYKNYSFFLEAKNMEIDLNNLKISSIVKEKLSNIEDNSKILNKLSILKDKNTNLTNTFITPEIEAKIDSMAIIEIQKSIDNLLAKKPIYVLKDDLKQNSIKIALDNIKITEQGVDIYISIQKIIIFIIIIIALIIITGILIYLIIKNPGKVIFGIFEITGSVLEATAEALI